jgi:hypothetical protein
VTADPGLLPRLARWLCPDGPPTRFVAFRLLVGTFATIYLLVRVRYFGDFSRHAPSDFAPIGVCQILTRPLPPSGTWLLAVTGVALGGLFVSGRGPRRIGAAAFAANLLWLTTYASSWGKILHSENLLVWHTAIVAIAEMLERGDGLARSWALRAASIATVLTYFVAGVTKLRLGGGAWVSGNALGDWLAFDALRKIELGTLSSPVAAELAARPSLLVTLAGYTLLVELGAPLALVSDRVARAWVLLAWLFHVGIGVTMAIGFFYPLAGVAFAPLLAVERFPLVRRAVRSRALA